MTWLLHFLLPPSVAMVAGPAVVLTVEATLGWGWTDLLVGPYRWAGLVPLVGGVAVDAWCGMEFAKAGGTFNFLNPPPKLVTTGPYRISRNPIYLGGTLILAGLVLLFESAFLLIYLGLYVLFLDRILIPIIEEPGLERRFGEEFRRYRGRVPRWIGVWYGRQG
ncbi:MAG: isoprenylcysteine carboxylmethyltransferase family protein [Chloroflexi bacterium]|nr:isoprenylcysteine carboxylmethyltransferase family protein [Chloroflexota bacterium]